MLTRRRNSMKKSYFAMVALIIASLVLAACGGGQTQTPAATEPPTEVMTEAPTEAMTEAPTEAPTEAMTEAPTEAPVSGEGLTIGQVTDLGGIDDKSFNASAFAGAERAVEELGGEAKYLESQQQSDYAKNIQQFVDEGTDLIVTVGFLLGVDTATAAKANPEQKFAIVDYAYPDCFGDTAVEGET